MGPVVDLTRAQKALRDLARIAEEHPELHDDDTAEGLAAWLDFEKAASDDDDD